MNPRVLCFQPVCQPLVGGPKIAVGEFRQRQIGAIVGHGLPGALRPQQGPQVQFGCRWDLLHLQGQESLCGTSVSCTDYLYIAWKSEKRFSIGQSGSGE